MFDPFTLALIGGAVGGLTNKRDPLTGALLGGGLGYGGGLLGGPTGYIDALGDTVGGSVAGASTNPLTMGQVTDTIKPIGQAMNTASAAKNLLMPNTPQIPIPQAPPPQIGQGGAQTLQQLAQGNPMMIAQNNEAQKKRRWGLLGPSGGVRG